MKIALITDTHFGARNDNVNFNEYFYNFYEDVFFPYLKDHNITTAVHLGDVMDRRKYVSYKIAKDFRTGNRSSDLRLLGWFFCIKIADLFSKALLGLLWRRTAWQYARRL